VGPRCAVPPGGEHADVRLEVLNGRRGSLPGQVSLLVRSGIYIMENLLLEELAADRHHEFLFGCLPLKMVGVTASPVRPVAIVPS
jgi:kynurenine formamidase